MPYDWRFRDSFHGRESEIVELVQRILRERFVVVTGPSGAGKTSLLGAGVVSSLQSLRHGKGVRNPDVGPVLLLREWGPALENAAPEEVLKTMLRNAGEELETRSKSDGRVFRSVRPTGSPYEYISELCSAFGSVVIIFDQFEELLRLRNKTAEEIVSIISQLNRRDPRVKILVGLREEYHKDLRSLEGHVGGLYGRTFWLRPLTVKGAEEAIIKSAEKKKGIDLGTLRKILKLLEDYQRPDSTQGNYSSASQYADLLTLQAILLEYYAYCKQHEVDLDDSSFESYRGSDTLEKLVGGSLQRWITTSLEQTRLKETLITAKELTKEDRDLIMAHCITRMASHFSSGSFKILVLQSDLVNRSLEDDLRRLFPQGFNQSKRFKLIDELAAQIKAGDKGFSFGFTKNEDSGPEVHEVTGGPASDKGWTRTKSIRTLVEVALEALERLGAGNVIRSSVDYKKDKVWELVHDGFAKPFIDWAAARQHTIEDALGSLNQLSDDIIIESASSLPKEIRGANWAGCWIGSGKSPKAILENIRFVKCSFKGVLFSFKCVFRHCTFIDCELPGALFKGCEMDDVEFKDCGADGTWFRDAVMGRMQFNSTRLVQVGFYNIHMTGGWSFAGARGGRSESVESARFDNLSGNHKLTFDNCNLQFCSWDKHTESKIEIKNSPEPSNCGVISER
ncbi:MAG: pentapeptide repeat-containing protein [archaeon]|nr:MAG: pentapeptide repeat-containing protein [archaeon]